MIKEEEDTVVKLETLKSSSKATKRGSCCCLIPETERKDILKGEFTSCSSYAFL